MKINRYKLKSNITTNDLIKLNAREGGIWINKESKLFLSKCFYYEPYEFEFSIGIAFKDNIHDWNDFDNILVLDEDFGQPYTPFYGDMFGKDVCNFPTLEFVIEKYNEYMSSLGIFEEI